MHAESEYRAVLWDGRTASPALRRLIREEPLSIRVQGNPYSVILRTPGDEMAHVAGFCLGEGIVDGPDDVGTIAFCDGADTNVVTVTLTDTRRARLGNILDRRGYVSQTSCGLCGKELVEDLSLRIEPIAEVRPLNTEGARQRLLGIGDHQPLRRRTRASHGAAIYDMQDSLLSAAEDVGRHNALDKAVGRLFLDGRLGLAAYVTLSSRVSYELVQKSARARIPVILGISRPTSLAVDLAAQLNMTLACLAENDGLYIFCGAGRLVGETGGTPRIQR